MVQICTFQVNGQRAIRRVCQSAAAKDSGATVLHRSAGTHGHPAYRHLFPAGTGCLPTAERSMGCVVEWFEERKDKDVHLLRPSQLLHLNPVKRFSGAMPADAFPGFVWTFSVELEDFLVGERCQVKA